MKHIFFFNFLNNPHLCPIKIRGKKKKKRILFNKMEILVEIFINLILF